MASAAYWACKIAVAPTRFLSLERSLQTRRTDGNSAAATPRVTVAEGYTEKTFPLGRRRGRRIRSSETHQPVGRLGVGAGRRPRPFLSPRIGGGSVASGTA